MPKYKFLLFSLLAGLLFIPLVSCAENYIVETNFEFDYKPHDVIGLREINSNLVNASHYETDHLVSEVESNENIRLYAINFTNFDKIDATHCNLSALIYENATASPSFSNLENINWTSIGENHAILNNTFLGLISENQGSVMPNDVYVDDILNTQSIKILVNMFMEGTLEDMLDSMSINVTQLYRNETVDNNDIHKCIGSVGRTIYYDAEINMSSQLLDMNVTFTVSMDVNMSKGHAISNSEMIMALNITITHPSIGIAGQFIMINSHSTDIIYDSTGQAFEQLCTGSGIDDIGSWFTDNLILVISIVGGIALLAIIYFVFSSYSSKQCAVDSNHWYCPKPKDL